MAPRKPDVIENPPVDSSSEEEESGSSGEESESSAGDPKKEESKLESDSEGDSDSESDPEPAKKNKQSVMAPGSDVTLPESSSAKRPLKKQTESEAKRLKISETELVKKPVTDEKAKRVSGMFQRLFSETDEIAMLQGLLDFASTKGDPSEESDAFCIHLKKLIDFNATKVQIVTKLQRLKKKYLKTVKNALKKGKSEDEIVFAKELDQTIFDLSRKIWGANGVVTSKSKKKLGGTPVKEVKLKPHLSPMRQEEARTVVDSCLSNARGIASFFKAENASVCGLDESTIIACWENVAEGAKKKEMEEKMKKLKVKQVDLCLHRSALVDETAKMIFKANAF